MRQVEVSYHKHSVCARLLPGAADIKPICFNLQSNVIYSYNDLAYLLSLDHLCKIWEGAWRYQN